MQSILEQVSSLLTGDLNYDRVAKAKQLINQFLDSPEWQNIKIHISYFINDEISATEFLAKIYWCDNIQLLKALKTLFESKLIQHEMNKIMKLSCIDQSKLIEHKMNKIIKLTEIDKGAVLRPLGCKTSNFSSLISLS